ncbi:hypothetical protein BGZ59_001980 [Podila verticillata]|nr:hypothetical protein BGZ59_001980 [Podila verticillata]
MFENEVLERNRAEEEAWLAEEMMEADEERAKADAAFAFSLIVLPGEEEFAAEEEAAQWCGEREHDEDKEDEEDEDTEMHSDAFLAKDLRDARII